jgi:hypothetical protein
LSNFSALASQPPTNQARPAARGGLKASFADRLTHRLAAAPGAGRRAVVSLGRYPGPLSRDALHACHGAHPRRRRRDFVIQGHEAEAAARVETADEAHEGLLGAVEALAVHGPAAMTMNVYAQLQQRAERSHGEAFDALVRRARERLYGAIEDSEKEPGDASGRVRKSFGLCEGADWGAAKSGVMSRTSRYRIELSGNERDALERRAREVTAP